MNAKKGKGRNSKGKKFSNRQREIESLDMRSSSRVPPDTRDKEQDCTRSAPNDWRWYAQNPQLLADYASLPFGDPVGNQLRSTIGELNQTSVPGVAAIEFFPSVGVATDENSPINVAMRRLYSFVRHANSGASNYDAPDLMMYMIAVDSAMMFHAWLKRAYGVMLDYTPYNRYYPRTLISAMGMNFADLEANLNDFRGYINTYAVKLSQLWIPNSMSYMARHTWMCEGIYTDGASPKAQTYLYTPVGFYKFGLDSEGAGSLTMQRISNTKYTFQALRTLGDSLLNPMISNEDFGIMSGDILKAFGPSGIVQIQGITEGYQILPVYSQEVLSQIENLHTIAVATASLNVTQETAVGTGYLKSQPTYVNNYTVPSGVTSVPDDTKSKISALMTGERMLNMHHDQVGPADVIVATRLALGIGAPTTTLSGTTISVSGNVLSCGSEIVTDVRLFWNTFPQSGMMEYNTLIQTNMWFVEGQVASRNFIQGTAGRLECFDWHPIVYAGVMYQSGSAIYAVAPQFPLCDVDFYTFINANNIALLHTTALLSEFTIPQLG